MSKLMTQELELRTLLKKVHGVALQQPGGCPTVMSWLLTPLSPKTPAEAKKRIAQMRSYIRTTALYSLHIDGSVVDTDDGKDTATAYVRVCESLGIGDKFVLSIRQIIVKHGLRKKKELAIAISVIDTLLAEYMAIGVDKTWLSAAAVIGMLERLIAGTIIEVRPLGNALSKFDAADDAFTLGESIAGKLVRVGYGIGG